MVKIGTLPFRERERVQYTVVSFMTKTPIIPQEQCRRGSVLHNFFTVVINSLANYVCTYGRKQSVAQQVSGLLTLTHV